MNFGWEFMKNDLSLTQLRDGKVSRFIGAQACYNVNWDRQRCLKYKQRAIRMPRVIWAYKFDSWVVD